MYVKHYEYVVYRGEEIICAGTKDEVITKLNTTKNTLDRIASSTTEKEEAELYKKNPHHQRLIAVKIETSEIEKELGLQKVKWA
ncbi:TPA: hypothetical protein I1462_000402 [Staphylococcus pseudintermedius]|uniref:Uncharacterized protein n=2 Tax=Staphylococcus intermedius group TaxID=2815305 RepID=A0A317Z8M3_STAPS|nr:MULTISPECIES: hypothetical protein [Staphylococcus intermedius group]ANQ88242.1 hypothetical protein A9I65_06225 [Staphylococcus pseudintermedius]AYG56536.1 hypothetical protein D8L98_09010 [Staphylococcus pseudintermedius]EGQ0365762.1 hypothetical protein [Staphylococcus pseudintermedius]EGQ2806330.1 hypothetical protein [Staphylococcus pseudintermedius]EGQ2853399.1 hypothetical protein [Staphylococcus pseudintermedius]